MVYREDALLKLAPVAIDQQLFHRATMSNTSALTALLKQTARDVHIPTQLPFAFGFWQIYGGYVGVASLIVVGLVILILFVKWKRQRIPAPEDSV